jgi:hypothetical protein
LASPSRQCSCTSVKDLLAENNIITLENFPCSSDVAPADFYQLSRLMLALKGRRFCDATDKIKNAMEELKRVLQNGLKEFFQPLYSRRQKFIVARGFHSD